MSEENDPLKQRFMREAPAMWEAYAKRAHLLQGKYWFRTTMTYRTAVFDEEYEYKTNGEERKLRIASKRILEGEKETYEEAVYSVNTEYAFRLQRKRPGSTWVVAELLDFRRQSLPPVFETVFSVHRQTVTDCVRLDDELLSAVIQRPGFRVERCSSVKHRDETLVEIAFSYTFDNPDHRPNATKKGKVLLDPARYWIVRSKELQDQDSLKKTRVTGLKNASNLLPVAEQLDGEYTWVLSPAQIAQGLPPKNKWTISGEYDLDEPSRLPDHREFTLSAYGLPEPRALGAKKPRQTYLWFALAGIVFFLLGVSIRFRKRLSRKMRENELGAE